LFVFEGGADFQQTIEHFRTLGAAGSELGIGLLVHILEPVKFVGDVQRRENRYLQRVDRQSTRRDLAHATVDELGKLDDVLSVAVRPDVVGLIVNLDTDGGTTALASMLPLLIMRPIPELI